jgi:transcriptional regulator of arginine metabolism
MNNHAKARRHQILRSIILERGGRDQNQLLSELRNHGFETTQATVSRDLQEMGFVKVRVGPGQYRYELLEKASKDVVWERLQLLFRNFVTDIKSAKNLILIKTTPGNANGVASLIDGLSRPEILGTVAGDDTILAVIDTDKNRRKVEMALRRLL